MTSGIRIAYLCERLGPFHFAQLNAASGHADIIAIEFSQKDQTYEWDYIEGPTSFQRVTLFSDAPINMQPIDAVVRRVNNVLGEVKPQVVALHGWEPPASLIALWWCLDNHTPSIILSDSNKHDEKRVWWKEYIKKQIVKLCPSGFVSGATAMEYLKSLGMPESRIFTGYGVVDNRFFAVKSEEYQKDSVEIRKKLCLPDKYFLTSNRFVQEKNLFFLLQAYAKYRKKAVDAPWKLVILGDGPLLNPIIRHREELGLNDDVILPGFKQYDELPAYYGLAEAFILSSIRETWGLVVNEAMACGLPVIVSSRCGCAPDLVQNRVNGFTFDPDNSDELANKLVYVSCDTCNRAEMGQASRKIIDCWSLDYFASNLVKAAYAAFEAPHPQVNSVRKALLWVLIHRKLLLEGLEIEKPNFRYLSNKGGNSIDNVLNPCHGNISNEKAVMNDKELKIAIITNVIPIYREGFYDRLFSRKDLFVKVYCQDRIPGVNMNTIQNIYPNNVKVLKYWSTKREMLSWQNIPWKEILCSYDVVFIDGNPRNIAHALGGTILNIIHHNVVLWTMAHSYRANMLTENIRLFWSLIFKYIFVYNDKEVDYLKRKGFKNNYIVGMNNGLDQKKIDAAILMWPDVRLKQWRIERGLENRTLLLSCSRLGAKNKYQLFVQALPAIVNRVPDLIWCVIGSGPEKTDLTAMVNNGGLSQYVRFEGELYDEETLAPWFLSSEIFIQPAAIGLSIMHAFGYGLPVVTHGNEKRQGPEYTAFEPDVTGRIFQEDNIQHFSETVIKLLRDNDDRSRMRSYVQNIAREKYNVDVMVERFVQISKKASNC